MTLRELFESLVNHVHDLGEAGHIGSPENARLAVAMLLVGLCDTYSGDATLARADVEKALEGARASGLLGRGHTAGSRQA